MRGRRAWRILRFMVIAAAFALVAGYVVMRLWNWVLPPVLGVHFIGYWQALALLILARLLFGGFRRDGFGPGIHWRRRMMERWERMTPEEREKFRAGMGAAFGGRCGSRFATPPAEETKAKA